MKLLTFLGDFKDSNIMHSSQFFSFLTIFMGILQDRAVASIIHRFSYLDIIERSFITAIDTFNQDAVKNYRIISSILSFLCTLASHSTFLNSQNSKQILRLIMLPLNDLIKSNKVFYSSYFFIFILYTFSWFGLKVDFG